MVFTALYSIVGVVIYASGLNAISQIIIGRLILINLDTHGMLTFASEDVDALRKKMFQGKTEINFETFLHFTLLKTKLISAQDVQRIQGAWDKLNFDGDDTLTLEEMYVKGVLLGVYLYRFQRFCLAREVLFGS